MKKNALFLLIMSLTVSIMAQNAPAVTPVSGDFLTSDLNGNIYAVKGPSLVKLDKNGTPVANYENYLLGDITTVDADNPLKIMLFYRDAAQIVFLDDKLTVITEPLDLFSQNFRNIELATYSTDNKIWLYDNREGDLIAVDFHLKELSRNHLTISNFNSSQFLSLQEKSLMMVHPDGVLFFDAFGTFLKSLPITSACPIQAVDSRIFFIRDDALLVYNYKLLEQSVICQLDKYVYQAIFSQGKVYYLDQSHRLNILFIR